MAFERNTYIDSIRITLSLFLPIVLGAFLHQLDKGLIIGFSAFLNGLCAVGDNNRERFYMMLSAGILITLTTALGSLFAPTAYAMLLLFAASLFVAGLVVSWKNEAIMVITYFGAVGWLIGSGMHAGGIAADSLIYLWILGVILSLLLLIMSFPMQAASKAHQPKEKLYIRTLLQRDSLIYAIELACLGVVCTAVAVHMNPQHGIWATAAALAVLRPERKARWPRITYRMLGTLIGAALTIIVVELLQNSFLLLLFAFVCSLLALILRKQHYGMFMIFATPLIIIVAGINAQASIFLAKERAFYTFIGIIFAALFTVIISLGMWLKKR